jgi:hypothetical protein
MAGWNILVVKVQACHLITIYNLLPNVILLLRVIKNLEHIVVYKAPVNTVINLVPYNVGKFLSSYTTGGFSRRTQLHEVSFS